MTEKKYIITETMLRDWEIQWSVTSGENVKLHLPRAPDCDSCTEIATLNQVLLEREQRLDAIKAVQKARIEELASYAVLYPPFVAELNLRREFLSLLEGDGKQC